ncbi:MAG TPA: ribonuclease HII [Candidatus Coprovivens excrementavium]|nr:ribonuclease HII [Candidatus Coprovivens excrementavium]
MQVKDEERDLLKYEKELYKKGITLIGGVDEVGRGPLVGPVVAACVILPVNYKLSGLDDSKKLSEKKREKFYDIIMKDAIAVGIGVVDAKKIDEINILEASRLAMKLAIENLNVKPEFVLSDAMKLDNIDIPYEAIIHGDSLSLSIAAGSVIAKVTRDRMMYELDEKYPEYGFAQHKGYPTKKHLENLQKYGILSNYRFTYKPVSDLINKMKVVVRK